MKLKQYFNTFDSPGMRKQEFAKQLNVGYGTVIVWCSRGVPEARIKDVYTATQGAVTAFDVNPTKYPKGTKTPNQRIFKIKFPQEFWNHLKILDCPHCGGQIRLGYMAAMAAKKHFKSH